MKEGPQNHEIRGMDALFGILHGFGGTMDGGFDICS